MQTERSKTLVTIATRLIGYLIVGGLLFYLGHTYYQAKKHNQNLQTIYKNKNRNLERLKRRNRVLAEKRRRLKTDPEVIERILREEYGMLEPGEFRIIE